MTPDSRKYEKRKVWDVLLRCWHWIFALAVSGAWYLGEFMEFATIRWHFYLGYTVLGCITLRILWGLFGPRAARFRSFPLSPSAISSTAKEMVKREPSGHSGHSAFGALSVVALLLVISGQALTGLFIESEDFFEYGPLAGYVSDETVRLMGTWHHRLAKAVLALVILHLSAIVFYFVWKRENLVGAMITGWKWVKRD